MDKYTKLIADFGKELPNFENLLTKEQKNLLDKLCLYYSELYAVVQTVQKDKIKKIIKWNAGNQTFYTCPVCAETYRQFHKNFNFCWCGTLLLNEGVENE